MSMVLKIPMRSPCLIVPDTWYWDEKERAETMALCKDLFRCPDNDHVCPSKVSHVYEHVVAAHKTSAHAKETQAERLCAHFMLDPRCVREASRCPTAAGFRALFSAMKQRTAALHSIDRLPLDVLVHEIYARLDVTSKRACRVVWRRVRKATVIVADEQEWGARLARRNRIPYYFQDFPSKKLRRFLQWCHDDFLAPLAHLFWPTCAPSRDFAGFALEVAAMGGAERVYRECLGFVKNYQRHEGHYWPVQGGKVETTAEEAAAFHTALCAGQFHFIDRMFGRMWTPKFWERIFSDGYAAPVFTPALYPRPAVTHWIEARNEFALGKWADEILARKLHFAFNGLARESHSSYYTLSDPDATAWDASPAVRADLEACAKAGIVSVLDRFKEGSTWTTHTVEVIYTDNPSPNAIAGLEWFYNHKRAVLKPNMCMQLRDLRELPHISVLDWFHKKGLLNLTFFEEWLFVQSARDPALRKWLCEASPRAAQWHYDERHTQEAAERMVAEWTAFDSW
jgi:hypothetical protein